MMDKKGRSDIEKAISAFLGVVVMIVLIGTLASSGVFSVIINSLTSAMGIIGALLGILIILAIVKAIIEAFDKR